MVWSSPRSAITCRKTAKGPESALDAGPPVSKASQLSEGRLPFRITAGPVLATLLFRAGGVNLTLRQDFKLGFSMQSYFHVCKEMFAEL
jgi:hypothetical protein